MGSGIGTSVISLNCYEVNLGRPDIRKKRGAGSTFSSRREGHSEGIGEALFPLSSILRERVEDGDYINGKYQQSGAEG